MSLRLSRWLAGASKRPPSAAANRRRPPSPVSLTDIFTGTARAIDPGSCTGDTHPFSAQPGTIAVTLVPPTPLESMTVQICSASTDCTLMRRRIDVGQTIEAQRNGRPEQTLSLLPLTCGKNAPPSPTPIACAVTVKYLH